MPSRPVAQEITLSTSTGVSGSALFGEGRRFAQLSWNNDSTRSIKGDVEGSNGRSGAWSSVIALTTSNTTGASLNLMSTGGMVFDKLRLNLSANETTAANTITLNAY